MKYSFKDDEQNTNKYV